MCQGESCDGGEKEEESAAVNEPKQPTLNKTWKKKKKYKKGAKDSETWRAQRDGEGRREGNTQMLQEARIKRRKKSECEQESEAGGDD